MKVDIRAATAADVVEMHRIRSEVRENRLLDPQQISERAYLPFVAAKSIWVAETRSRIVGFAAVDASAKRVWALFVDPSAEGLGIGRALLLRMTSWAQEQGLDRLSLSTEKGSRAARFYREARWTEAGTTPTGEALFEALLRS